MEEYARKLSMLGKKSETVAKKALYKGANILADQMKSNLIKVIKAGDGDLVNSMGITPISVDKNGIINIKIGFDGYSGKGYKGFPKGTPNQLKARVLESGSSHQKKTPFIRPAVNVTKKKIQTAMNEIIEKEIENMMK